MTVRDAYLSYITSYFSRWSRVYDFLGLGIFFVYQKAVKIIQPCAEDTLLDICTGTGEIARRCALKNARVTGLDITRAMLQKAHRRCAGLSAHFIQSDARQVPCSDHRFDVVVLSMALHDMPRKVSEEVVREAIRVGRKRLVILDYELPANRFWHRIVLELLMLYETVYLRQFSLVGVRGILKKLEINESFITQTKLPLFSIYEVRLNDA